MSEADFRKEVLKLLAPLDPIPIESALVTAKTMGIPDVNISGGWIELKWLRAWPKRPGTPVRIPHYTDDQKNWSARRAATGETVWLLLKCRNEWLLFDSDSSKDVGTLTKQEMIDNCRMYWPTKPTSEDICKILERV